MRSIFYCAVVIVFAAMPEAEAGPVRHKPPTPFSVALEPFKLTRSVVHAAAAPIVHNAPRILAATAVAPIKLAYYAPRRLRPRPPRGSGTRAEDPSLHSDDSSVDRPEHHPPAPHDPPLRPPLYQRGLAALTRAVRACTGAGEARGGRVSDCGSTPISARRSTQALQRPERASSASARALALDASDACRFT